MDGARVRWSLLLGIGVLCAALAVIVWATSDDGLGVDAAPADADPPQPRTVLMIPGYGGGDAALRMLGKQLRRDAPRDQDLRTEVLDIGRGRADLRRYAVRANQRAGEEVNRGRVVDVIGFSAGGITARVGATADPGLYDLVITLAAPHQGTWMASLGDAVGRCPTACQQLRPGSELLASLPEVVGPDWLTVFSSSDGVIVPATSSELSGAQTVRIQNHCDAFVPHAAVPTHPQTVAAVGAFIHHDPLPDSCQAD